MVLVCEDCNRVSWTITEYLLLIAKDDAHPATRLVCKNCGVDYIVARPGDDDPDLTGPPLAYYEVSEYRCSEAV